MMTLTIDSSVFLSALLEDGHRRNETVFFLTAIRNKQEPIVIPSVVATEVSWDEKLLAEAGKITKAITPAEFIRLDN